ncbi:MAG: hypothetical protein V7746_14255 [Halioglobus sp.]
MSLFSRSREEAGEGESRAVWFPAKKYGWGWGFPCAWQGWVVLGLYILVVLGTVYSISPDEQPLLFAVIVICATFALCLVCYLKGDKLKWRKGG